MSSSRIWPGNWQEVDEGLRANAEPDRRRPDIEAAPLAQRAGEAVADAIRFVVGAFKSGQMLDLVSTALKIGFADAVNSLVNGFRIAVGFLWNALTDGGMWANLGKLYLGIAVKFYNKLFRGLEAVINFLAAGMEWVGALLVKQLLKIPGVDQLLGIKAEDVNTVFGDLYQSRKDGKLFGLDLDGMEGFGDKLTGEGSSGLAERLAAAAAKAIQDAGTTSGTLDAQRENNRLTGETNRLLQQANRHLSKLGGGGAPVAAFG